MLTKEEALDIFDRIGTDAREYHRIHYDTCNSTSRSTYEEMDRVERERSLEIFQIESLIEELYDKIETLEKSNKELTELANDAMEAKDEFRVRLMCERENA